MLNFKKKVYKALVDNKLSLNKDYYSEKTSFNLINIIKNHLFKIINLFGIKLSNPYITIDNLTKLYHKKMFRNTYNNDFPKIELIKNIYKISNHIIYRELNFTSICENHLIIFDGKIALSYIPQDSLISLNDINKLIYFLSHRLQTQYKLSKQIMITLQTILSTKSVAIYIEANHYCVKYRNINTKHIKMINFLTTGKFITDKSLIHDFVFWKIHYSS